MILRFSKGGLWRLLPGIVAAIATLGLTAWGKLEGLDQALYRSLFQGRGTLDWHSDIVLLTIDDASLAQ